ncbi:LolA family protein [Ferdinandcohnia quinoae]|uniref:Outer membrane lipoprotein carrier protein LolA n=1 Tax=Fredinandcohnia quinoae TaxID=2918902 RepID=A0AAW5E2W4_9BACI|nr:outer membrane lipoprotein carrier protein LolA [Fredinandcohnia sp. SECRCQ15]MCH1627255.1 outer membrane lipoprotein carrier protein LolA [Fredinandcohnia sp. SECRCQ15]
MKKNVFLLLLGLLVALALAGCGEKSQKDVVEALDEKVAKMTGYKADAKMTLQTGNDPQVYQVEIWHKEPEYYRVNLKNAEKDQSQMILRNDDGVFVLTPALNKSFHFQSDWPQNSSQAYLVESLVNDIKSDPEAKFTATKDNYVFETKTNYKNNKMLPIQEITINKKDLAPVQVKVMDPDRNPLLIVDFKKVEFNASFDKSAFEVEKNMNSAQLELEEVPVMGEGNSKPFAVLYPEEGVIPGVELVEEKEMKTDDGIRYILTFGGGEKSFTLIQERATVAPAGTTISVSGEPIDLGFTVGVLSENAISWTHEGVDFMVASTDLTQEELYEIARTVQGKTVK